MNEGFNDFIIGEIIGEGTTGKVKLCRSKNTNKTYAIKIIKKKLIANQPVVVSKVKREISIMQFLNHPNLLHLHTVFQDTENIYLVEQYAAYGCLFDKVLELPYLDCVSFFRQIIYGLEYLHSKGFCHRDLKPENILLNDPESLVIADFGLACWMPHNIATTYCGSPHYIAPEITYGTQYDGSIADIWSAGVILYAMLAKSLPFPENSIRKLTSDIRCGKYEIPPTIDPLGADLIRRLLTVDPTQRITIQEIKQHPFFRLGLPEDYVLPTPMPMICHTEPYYITEESIEILRSIGFEEEELNDLQKEGANRAKAFVEYLNKESLTQLLIWDNAQLPNHPLANQLDTLNYNINEQVLREQQKIIVGIHLKRPELLVRLQRYLTNNGYEWLHLDETLLIARKGNGILLKLKIEWENNARYVEIKGENYTATTFIALINELTSILRPYISIFDNSQLSDEMNTLISEASAVLFEGEHEIE